MKYLAVCLTLVLIVMVSNVIAADPPSRTWLDHEAEATPNSAVTSNPVGDGNKDLTAANRHSGNAPTLVEGAFLNPQFGTVFGTVTEADSTTPIEGVLVRFMDQYGVQEYLNTLTDSLGHYTMTITQFPYSLYGMAVSKSGYLSQFRQVLIDPNQDTQVDFVLIWYEPPPPPPDACDSALYSNGADVSGVTYSQCDFVWPIVAATADDFELPGTGDYVINGVAAFLARADGLDPNSAFIGINVIIYADNNGVPGGHPRQGGYDCDHDEDIDGGIILYQRLDRTQYTYNRPGIYGNYQFILPITPITLTGGVRYWIEVEPMMYSAGGHDMCGFIKTDQVTGNYSMVMFPEGGIGWWSDQYQTDVAFCLFGQPVGPSCQYITGDANGNGSFNGLDVVYSVTYFKGGPPPPYSCECTLGSTWFVSGDVNASCNFNGLDVSYMVSYLKGGPAPHPCANCPPAAR